MGSAIYFKGRRFEEKRHASEEDFERFLVENAKLVLGEESIFIDAKKKISSKTLGGTIPDGFIFDLSDLENPEFYLLEVELSKHSFNDHIFPQITKFFTFFKNPKSQSELIEKIFFIISNDETLKQEFKARIGKKEIFKLIKDTVENSHNILLVLDEMKEEMAEIMSVYTDTWDKMVRLMVLKKYAYGDDCIISATPDFSNLKLPELSANDVSGEAGKVNRYSEEYHLDGIKDDVKKAYQIIKQQALEYKGSLIFNPQKYYVSIKDKKNVTYITFRKKKMNIVLMLNDAEAQKVIKSHEVYPLSEGVKRFYGGECCEVSVEGTSNINEIVEAIKSAVKNNL